MKTSQPVTIALAAAALVGAIGFAYAQSSTDGSTAKPQNTQPSTMDAQNPAPGAPAAPAVPAGTDSGSAPMPERAPQADRN